MPAREDQDPREQVTFPREEVTFPRGQVIGGAPAATAPSNSRGYWHNAKIIRV